MAILSRMDPERFERFQQFMLESAARHEAEMAAMRESMRESTARHNAKFAIIDETMGRVARSLEVLVNNQIRLQHRL